MTEAQFNALFTATMNESPTFVPLEILTGEINAAEGSGKAHFFHAPTPESVRAGEKETFIGTAMKECPRLGTKGHSVKITARKNIREEIGKAVFQTTWALREGEIFKVFAQTSAGGADWKARTRTASVFIRVRAGAPLHMLRVKVPGVIADSTFPFWYLRGRFDVLTLEEAEAEGAQVLDYCRDHFKPVNTNALFETEVMEPALITAPVLETKEVGGRVMAVAVRRRKLNLGT
jgi:hypothetical protein